MLSEKFTKLTRHLAFSGLVLLIGADMSYGAASLTAVAGSSMVDDDDDKRKGKGKEKDKGRGGEHGDRGRGRGRDDDDDRRSSGSQRGSDQEAYRQQRQSDHESRRQQQMSDWNSRQQQRQNERNRDNSRDYRRGNDGRRVVQLPAQAAPQAFWNQIFNRGGGQQGFYRDDRKRYEREQKRYLKDQRKAERRDARIQHGNYSQNIYNNYPPAYSYDQGYRSYDQGYGRNDLGGGNWKDFILRSVIANVLGGGNGIDLGGIIPQQGYYQPSRNGSGYSPDYSSGYSPAYRQSADQYYGPAPVNYGYGPSGYDQSGYRQPSGVAGLLGALPIAEILQQYTGGNDFLSSLVGSFITQGYDQGYLAGENARQGGYQNAEYNDPYAYENGSGDLYSTSLGDNRRYLSEGYDLGYRDALNGNAGYDPQSEGNVDLVGALLNNVLSGI
ncbi:MAG: hypothetical protein WKF34_05715 [Pyrinomonadaceae bacterium]